MTSFVFGSQSIYIVLFPIGFCDFGPNCRFSHMSEVDLAHLRRQVEGKSLGFGWKH